MDKLDYNKIAYLLGCYMVIVDKEINQMEVDVLDNYLPLSRKMNFIIRECKSSLMMRSV